MVEPSCLQGLPFQPALLESQLQTAMAQPGELVQAEKSNHLVTLLTLHHQSVLGPLKNQQGTVFFGGVGSVLGFQVDDLGVPRSGLQGASVCVVTQRSRICALLPSVPQP